MAAINSAKAAISTASGRPLLELARYAVSSALALGLDTGLYTLSLYLHAPLAAAAALGFGAGLLLVYLLSVRWVFARRSQADPGQELLIFVCIGIAGLLLTEYLLALLVNHAGFAPVPAKLLTAGVVFIFNFATRKALLFSHQYSGNRKP